MTEVKTLITKYTVIFTDLTLPQSWTGIPIFISEVTFKLLPQVMKDVEMIEKFTPEEKKQAVNDVIITCLDIAFDEVTKHTEFSQDEWNVQCKDYINPYISKLVDAFVTVKDNEIKFFDNE